MLPPHAFQARRSDVENGRSPIGSEAMRRAARCSDLGPGGCAPQVINDCAADADGLVLGQRRSEEVAPLTGASPMVGGALNVHAPQCTSQTGRPERPDWGRVHGRTTCLGEAASTWHSALPFAPRRHPVSLGQDQRRLSMPSARLDWLIGLWVGRLRSES